MKYLSVKAQLFFSFIFMALIPIVVGMISLHEIRKISVGSEYITQSFAFRSETIEQLKYHVNDLDSNFSSLIEHKEKNIAEEPIKTIDSLIIQLEQTNSKPPIKQTIAHLEHIEKFNADLHAMKQITLSIEEKLNVLRQLGKLRSQSINTQGYTQAIKTLQSEASSILDHAYQLQDWKLAEAIETFRGYIINTELTLQEFFSNNDYNALEKSIAKLTKQQSDIVNTISSQPQQTDIVASFNKYQSITNKVLEQLSRVHEKEKNNTANLYQQYENLTEQIKTLSKGINEELKLDKQDLHRETHKTYILLGLIIVTGVILSLIFASFISRIISNPLSQCVAISDKIAAGDLSVNIPIPNKTEMGRLFCAMRSMASNLQNIVLRVKETALDLVSRNRSLTEANQQIAIGAKEQAENIQTIAQALSENTGKLKTTADLSLQANNIAMKVNNRSTEGNHRMQLMLEAMTDIHGSSAKMAEINETVNTIAFQTNLLSLNASVEAARAGQHGLGFAVVANEVRNLALKTSEAARDIQELLSTSASKAEYGREMASQAAASLNTISDDTHQVSSLIETITQRSLEQVESIDKINESLEKINTHTQRNVAISEESAIASDQLLELTSNLKQMVSYFRLQKE